jgi:hypothetical protein
MKSLGLSVRCGKPGPVSKYRGAESGIAGEVAAGRLHRRKLTWPCKRKYLAQPSLQRFNIREMRVGEYVVKNVAASVGRPAVSTPMP